VSAAGTGVIRPSTERGEGVDSLSAREVQVLQLVAEGKSNKDIGVALGLSALTVKSHLARIARKLGTGDRAEMVATSLRSGVIA
jgi:DNA-binding CsgD family transcriptional regulator